MCEAGVSLEKIELQSVRMDTRLALNYFPTIYLMCIAAWAVYQTALGEYIMAPIATTFLIGNVYFTKKFYECEEKGDEKW